MERLMPKKLTANELKILIWKSNPDIYISLAMLDLKTDYGNTVGNQIVLSPKIKNLKEMQDTLVHELLHVALPDADEDVVRAYTKKVVKSLTPVERVHLILKLGQHLKKVDL
jgi:hypothetical protein